MIFIAPQFLFVRPDEYALFMCFGKEEWCILTGNPGISKSCFQWKYILFCYRPELFDKFSPFVEEQAEELMEDVEDVPSLESLNDLKVDDSKCAEQVSHNDTMDDEKLNKKTKIEEQTLTEQDYVKELTKLNRQRDIFIPDLIVRTLAGEDSWLFFVGLDVDVLFVKHDVSSLRSFTDENTTILDMYYKDELGELVGIQATTSKKHPKAVWTYEKFYEEIGTTPNITPLKIYYLIIPCQVQTYEQNSYPDDQFRQNVKQGIGIEWRNNISFYALVPPNNFRLKHHDKI